MAVLYVLKNLQKMAGERVDKMKLTRQNKQNFENFLKKFIHVKFQDTFNSRCTHIKFLVLFIVTKLQTFHLPINFLYSQKTNKLLVVQFCSRIVINKPISGCVLMARDSLSTKTVASCQLACCKLTIKTCYPQACWKS